MIVISLSACPQQLRGYLSRFLLEVNPGIFVGRANARIRDSLWETVEKYAEDGHATMVYPTRDNEQRIGIRTLNPTWKTVDCDGITLIQRPTPPSHRYAPKEQTRAREPTE